MKTCFRCNQLKPLSDYHTHKGMADGRLNKCKVCARADVREYRLKKLKDPAWAEKEVDRSRKKMALKRAGGINPQVSKESRAATLKKHALLNPKKHSARLQLSNAIRDGKITRKPCSVCGCENSEGHHDNYDKPLDVTWLCPKHHAERHVYLRKQERILERIMEESI